MSRWRAWVAAGALLVAPAAAQDVPDAAARDAWLKAHPVLRIALDPQQGGELTAGESNPLIGEYLAMAARGTGVRFERVRTGSWAESVAAFKARKVDILPSTADPVLTADIGTTAWLSAPFYAGRTLIVTRTVGPATVDLWHLHGRTVAFKGGGQYEAWLQREHPEITRLPLRDIHQVLAAVESGIADAAIGVDIAYYPMVRRDFLQSLRVAGDIPELPVSIRVAVQRDEPEVAALLTRSLHNLPAGESEAVVERWLETAYLREPTVSQVIAAYGLEAGLALAFVVAMVFAVWQMRRAQLASQRGEQQKTMLLAVMSHEVRNAVNAMASSIDLMARQPMTVPQRDLMAIAQASSRNLQNLLKSALDYTRSEVQGFTPDPTACDVLAVAREAMESQRMAIDAKGLDVRLDLPMGPLPWLLLDEVRVRQLLENLFANAVKFTEQGHVGIALWQGAGPDADGVRHLVMEVFDTGIGLPPERQSRLFRPFAQARRRHDTRLGGSGLGLAICRDIARHLGGQLELSSTLGVGTAVRVELPTSLVPAGDVSTAGGTAGTAGDPGWEEYAAAHGAGPANERLAHPEPSGSGTILLVEDHPANRQIIAAQLAFLGFSVDAVAHGQAAIDAFVPERYAGILLDCELPDMQGYDIATELRARERITGMPRTRMVAISANEGDDHVRRCAESGIDLVLGKPLSLESLRSALILPPGDAMNTAFREETLRDLVAIRLALEQGDGLRARLGVHRVKGAALMCGEPDIVTLAEELEEIIDADESVAAAAVLLDEIRGLLGE